MMIGGLRIVTVPNWKRIPDGTYAAQFQNHPLICWLDRKLPWLGIGQHTESTFLKFRDADPIHDLRGSVVYCSQAQYAELMRKVPLEDRLATARSGIIAHRDLG